MKEDVETKEELKMKEATEPKQNVVTREDIEAANEAKPRAETEPRPEAETSRAAEPPRDVDRADEAAGLFEHDRAGDLRNRWSEVQARFVDDPREAVKAADALVDEVIRDLTTLFADERSGLETQWGRNEKVSTEDLRVALRRYRAFFERLLAV